MTTFEIGPLKAAPGTSGGQPADGDGGGSGGDGAGIAFQPMFFSAPIRPISFAVATAAPVTLGFSAGDASAASGTDSFARALDPVETIGADTFKAVLSSITIQGNAGFDRRLAADLIDASRRVLVCRIARRIETEKLLVASLPVWLKKLVE